MVSLPVFLKYDLVLILLLCCIVLFGYLALKSRNLKSFQFQISVFILIWISGEIANVLLYNEIISLPYALQEIGYEIHFGSMVFFAIFLYARYYFSTGRGKQLIENVEIEEYHPTTKKMGSEDQMGDPNQEDADVVSPNEKKS
jgi:hypothetical protein